MNIVTSPEKYTPSKLGNWLAWDEDAYDGPGAPMGIGQTEDEAISDLIMQLGEFK